MIELAFASWIYFEACGFELGEDAVRGDYAITVPAPNIAGYWIRKETVNGIITWRTKKGINCTSLFISAHDLPLHVIGTTEEVLEKLRD